MLSYNIEGKFQGKWIVLFGPFARASEARERLLSLQERNPACRYRLQWQNSGEPIVERLTRK